MGVVKAVLTAIAILLYVNCAKAQVTFNTTTTCSLITLSNNNLTASLVTANTNANTAPINAIIPVGAKVYFEIVINAYTEGNNNAVPIGVSNLASTEATSCNSGNGGGFLGNSNNSVSYNPSFGEIYLGGTIRQTLAPFKTPGSIVSLAVDWQNKKLWVRVNGGGWDNNGTDNPATNTGGQDISVLDETTFNKSIRYLIPAVQFRNLGGGTVTGQFASASWSFAAPSGFSQLMQTPPAVVSSLRGASTALTGSTSASISGGLDANFNMINDFGAACNGVTNDDPVFAAAGTAMRADPRVAAGANVTVTVPPGAICVFTTCSSGSYFSGLNNFTLIMTGATFNLGAGACQAWSNFNLDGSSFPGQAIQTITATNTCVTTLTPTDAGFYSPTRWALIGGMAMQGNSFPMNFATFEFQKVKSANSSTGVVCFNAPLANTYKQTWPSLGNFCAGWACGGDAHIYLMDKSWPFTWTLTGGTWNAPFQTIINSQNLVISNSVSGQGSGTQTCFEPTFGQTITYNNVNFTCMLIYDKLVKQLNINTSTISQIVTQSPNTTQNLSITGGTTNLAGLPLHTTCNNATLSGITLFEIFGAPLTFDGTNCVLTNNIVYTFTNNFSYGDGTVNTVHFNTNGNGILLGLINIFSSPGYWAPGTTIDAIGRTNNLGWPYTISDVFCPTTGTNPCSFPGVSGGQFDIVTNYTGTVPSPTVTVFPGQPPGGSPDPLPHWSCSGCTGAGITQNSLAAAPAQNVPLATYLDRTYTCTANIPNVPNSFDINANNLGLPLNQVIMGVLSSSVVNVLTADTNPAHASPLSFRPQAGMFIQAQTTAVGANSFSWDDFYDLKTVGKRTVTQLTDTGFLSQDIAQHATQPIGAVWFGGAPPTPDVNLATDLTTETASMCPVVQVTYQATR